MKRILVFVLSLGLVACANYRPIVDMQGVSQAQYESDLKACQWYAGEVKPMDEAVMTGFLSAAFGAATGAVLGAVSGVGAGYGAKSGTAIGGMTGLGYGAVNAGTSQKNIITRCMAFRGYRVLR